jgi:hypothetical protein
MAFTATAATWMATDPLFVRFNTALRGFSGDGDIEANMAGRFKYARIPERR